MTQEEKAAAFRALHEREGTFVMPNPWDAGSARALAKLGFEALATTSAGVAFSIGKIDSLGEISREEILENARVVVEATDLPVSADLENGFGHAPEDCAETIRRAMEVGLVGGSIEDMTGDRDNPVYDLSHAAERIQAAAEAARGKPFVLTARAENHIQERHDLDDTIRRLQAYEMAGADVLYAPGLPNLDAFRQVCQSVSKPVNGLIGLWEPVFTVAELQECGVKRISTGGSLARAAFDGFFNAAKEIKEEGTFTYASRVIGGRDIYKLVT